MICGSPASALFVVGWLVGHVVLDHVRGGMAALDLNVTESMIERFGLFTIIVLGEVVVGVMTGMSDAERTTVVIVPSTTDAARLPQIYRSLRIALAAAATASLAAGALRPTPWLLALILVFVLSAVWFTAIKLWVKRTEPDEHVPVPGLD